MLFTSHSLQREHQKCWKDRLIWRRETDLKAPHGCLWIHRICLFIRRWNFYPSSRSFFSIFHRQWELFILCHIHKENKQIRWIHKQPWGAFRSVSCRQISLSFQHFWCSLCKECDVNNKQPRGATRSDTCHQFSLSSGLFWCSLSFYQDVVIF